MQAFKTLPAALLAALLLAACASTETAVVTDRPEPVQPPQQPDVVEEPPVLRADVDASVGRFDTGKMWTFDNPPIDYFEEAYGFRPDSAWFARARLGALRISGCTASFVSPSGLVMTNHHCAREHVTEVTRPGERLLDDGFYAASLEEERAVEEMYAEQLISIEDITEEVYAAGPGRRADAEQRRQRAEQIEQRMDREAKAQDSLLTVEVIELYEGGQYSAYTFRRYEDVRLVMAPQLLVGSFGGDPDNFTFPRYSLDASFFRVYDGDAPLTSPNYFAWSTRGAAEGDPVFVIGNPGTTSRLWTVGQLEFERDYTLPQGLDVLRRRLEILSDYLTENPPDTAGVDLRTTRLSISNQVKKNEGELAGLHDPALITRRAAAERQLREAIAGRDTLQQEYGRVIDAIAELQRSKAAVAPRSAAFTYFASPMIDSHVLVRAVYGYIAGIMRQRGAPPDRLEEILEEAHAIEDWPEELEREMLAARLRELQNNLGRTDPTVNRILGGRTPEEVAARIIEQTALTDSAAYAEILDDGYLGSGDVTVPLAEAITPLYFSIQEQVSGLQTSESELNADLALARFALYGTDIPPDATFSLRIADGVVAGYPFNGTVAPSYTTYYGMYSRYYAHGGEGTEWDLPEEWLNPPLEFDLSTPLNLVSTNDITGGNSGSPLLNRDLQVVGLIFDSNIDALQNTYIYLDERGRAISVDARGILEALDDMYGADRLVTELTTGELISSGEEASERP